ncbi:unnamed protein product, partial [Effrenium voratum]
MGRRFGLGLVALAAAELSPISIDPTGHFVDGDGRVRIFHGVNAVYKESPWLPRGDAFSAEDSLDAETMDLLQEWGFNVVRLGVMWPGVEPAPGRLDAGYLKNVSRISWELAERGVYTLADLHQDLGSRYFCGEGVPEAYVEELFRNPGSRMAQVGAFPAPFAPLPKNASQFPELPACLQRLFSEYYSTYQVGALFDELYRPGSRLHEGFLRFWSAVAKELKDLPQVLGYELLNEPSGTCLKDNTELGCKMSGESMPIRFDNKVEAELLTPLYQAAAEKIRAEGAQQVIFYEATVWPKLGAEVFPAPALGADPQQALAYHIYCAPGDGKSLPAGLLCDAAQQIFEHTYFPFLEKHRLAGFMTEFGAVAGNAKELTHLSNLLRAADAHWQSWTYWQLKKFKDFTTANSGESMFMKDGTVEVDKLRTLTRSYAPAIAGRPLRMDFDSGTRIFELDFMVSVEAPTEIYINEALHYPAGYALNVLPPNCLKELPKVKNLVRLALADNACLGKVCYDQSENGEDPTCMAYDMSKEPITYLEQELQRFATAQRRLFELSVAPGEPYRLYGEAASSMLDRVEMLGHKLVNWIGGIEDRFVHREGKASEAARPAPRMLQQRALALLLRVLRPSASGLLPPEENFPLLVEGARWKRRGAPGRALEIDTCGWVGAMASSARVPPMPSSRIPLPFSPEEYAGRLQRVREGMQKEQLDLVVLTEPENIFYLTGYQTVGEPQIQALLLPAEGAPSLVTRLLEVTNATFRSNLQPQNLHVYADFESGIDKVCELLQSFQVSRLGLEMQSRRLLARHWTKLEALAKTKGMKLCEASHLVPRLRLVKTSAELAVLRRACSVCAAGVLAGQEASAGETETEIAGKAYQAMAKVGGEYPAFPPFVCIGQNGCLGHYPGSSSGGVLREGEVLFLEIGGCFERYHGAMMRTCFVGHQLPPLLQQAEAAVVAAMDVAAKAMKPGAKAKEVDQVARAALTRADKAWTMSLRSGYSIGIGFYTDWGEAEHFKMDPGSEQVLEEGMVIHLIPWVQVPEYGGVGLSDTVLVTNSGAVSLFEQQIPRQIRLIPPPPERPFGPEQAQRVRRVLGLEPTPLVKLELKDFEGLTPGQKSVYVKDESKRMGLQAFKVVGGAYAMLRFMCKRLALPVPEGAKGAEEVQRLYVERFGATTFVTATDGNHGRGVAWAARLQMTLPDVEGPELLEMVLGPARKASNGASDELRSLDVTGMVHEMIDGILSRLLAPKRLLQIHRQQNLAKKTGQEALSIDEVLGELLGSVLEPGLTLAQNGHHLASQEMDLQLMLVARLKDLYMTTASKAKMDIRSPSMLQEAEESRNPRARDLLVDTVEEAPALREPISYKLLYYLQHARKQTLATL